MVPGATQTGCRRVPTRASFYRGGSVHRSLGHDEAAEAVELAAMHAARGLVDRLAALPDRLARGHPLRDGHALQVDIPVAIPVDVHILVVGGRQQLAHR